MGMSAAEAYAASAAAVRASIERGDYSLIVRDRPMRPRVVAGESVGGTVRPVLAARTDEAVADDSNGTDLQLGMVTNDADGQDADTVEHIRQSRLSRFQRLA